MASNSAVPPAVRRRRGRPPKFGRPAKLVAVTLPTDVVAWLEGVNPDLGRAVVALHDEALHRRTRTTRPPSASAELVEVGEGRALIVVDPGLVEGLEGVAAIPFGEGRAFLALEPRATMADLELSVVDMLERRPGDARREELAAFRQLLRSWRTSASLVMEPRAIIVATRKAAKRRT